MNIRKLFLLHWGHPSGSTLEAIQILGKQENYRCLKEVKVGAWYASNPSM